MAATCVIALCAGQYSVSVPEVIKILASRFVNVTKTWSNTAEGVVFTLRLPRMIGAVLVGSALSLSGAAYQGVFKNPLVAPDLLGVSSGACVGASVAILLHLNSFGVQAMAFVAGILAVGLTLFIPRLIKNTNMTMLVLSGIIVKGIMDSVMGIIKYVADPETELQSITYWQLGSLTAVLPKRFVYCRAGDHCSICNYFSSQMEDKYSFSGRQRSKKRWAFQLQLFEILL